MEKKSKHSIKREREKKNKTSGMKKSGFILITQKTGQKMQSSLPLIIYVMHREKRNLQKNASETADSKA